MTKELSYIELSSAQLELSYKRLARLNIVQLSKIYSMLECILEDHTDLVHSDTEADDPYAKHYSYIFKVGLTNLAHLCQYNVVDLAEFYYTYGEVSSKFKSHYLDKVAKDLGWTESSETTSYSFILNKFKTYLD